LKKLLLTLLAASVISGSIFASGFQINESGAKAMSMAGAFTGVANDASAVFFNPAAMTFLDGTQIMAGATLISPSASFRGVAPSIDEYKMEEKLFTPINFFVTHKFSDNFAMGISVNNPYGLGSTWPKDWIGKYLAVETEVRTFFANISFAYKIVDELSIAVGGSYAYGDVTISKYSSLAPFNADAFVELKGDATTFGFNAAIFWNPIDRIRLGITFRSESKFDFTGDGTADYPAQFEGKIPTGNISASLTTPMNLTFGGSVKAAENFMFSFDWQWVGWSSYDKLEVTYDDFMDENGQPYVSSADRNYRNSFIYRLGTDWGISETFNFRSGILYDFSPVRTEYVEPSLPDADRIGFNLGIGIEVTEGFNIDIAYMYLMFKERHVYHSEVHYTDGDSGFNGVYNSKAHLLGLNLSYQF